MKANHSFLYALSLSCALIAACAQSRGPAAGHAPAVATVSTPTAATAAGSALPTPAPSVKNPPVVCSADPSWVVQPSFPLEVPNQEGSLCDFQKLAWRDFLALVQPLPGSSALVFESWMSKEGLFQPERYQAGRKLPFAWGEPLPVPKQCAASAGKLKGVRLMGLIRPRAGGFAGEIQQAGSNTAPIVDQKGNLVFYEQRLNKTQYDYLTGCGLFSASCFDSMGTTSPNSTSISFPDESIEIKTAWRVVSSTARPKPARTLADGRLRIETVR